MDRTEFIAAYSQKIGMAKARYVHQFIIGTMFSYMYPYAYERGLFIAPEPALTRDLNDLQPDVLVSSRSTEPLLIIEVARTSQIKKLNKKIDSITARFPEIEAFIYDYQAGIWYSNVEQTSGTVAYSPLLDIDLDGCFTDEIIEQLEIYVQAFC